MSSSPGYVRDLIRQSSQRSLMSSLKKAARTEKARLAETQRNASTEPRALRDIFPAAGLETPEHLDPLLGFFGRVADARRTGAAQAPHEATSVPPRHWKTTTILGGAAGLHETFPGYRTLYLTYSHEQAERKSRELHRIWRRLGHGVGDRNTFAEWSTDNGGMLRFAGLIGGATGDGFDLIIVDDPYRNRADAESLTIRRRTEESFDADVYTRQQNTPTAILVNHTRWHTRDLIAAVSDPQYRDGRPFRYTNIPAVDPARDTPDGVLLHRYWPIERLRPFMANAYDWASLFQGEPVPRGAEVFEAPTLTDTFPTSGRYVIGVDLAYTAKTSADHSVALVLCRTHDGTTTIVDMHRHQVQATDFALTLRSLAAQYPGAQFVWYASGTEQGSAQFIRKLGVPLNVKAARGDKLVRATPAAAAWNAGRILVPREASWAPIVIDEVTAFTGLQDPHDDIVDALAAAWDAIDTGTATVSAGAPRRFGGGRVGWKKAMGDPTGQSASKRDRWG